MSWRLAESLLRLREQINKLYPDRKKNSDGGIGDAAHASRSSDHNPWVKDGVIGIVTAIDVTHDPASGCDGQTLADALVESQDERIKYIIYNRRMISSYPANGKPAWTWRPYSGVNAHKKHMHISVQPEKDLYDSKAEWAIGGVVRESEPLTARVAPISAELNGDVEPPTTVVKETTIEKTVEPTGDSPGLVEKTFEQVKTIATSEEAKTVASTGFGKLSLKVAGGSAIMGLLSAIGTWWKQNWQGVVFTLVFLGIAYLVYREMGRRKHEQKMEEARIKADKNLNDVEFKKG